MTVYIFIDELYQRYVPDSVSTRRNVKDFKMLDTKIITISLGGKIVRLDSENAWYVFAKNNYGFLFPAKT